MTVFFDEADMIIFACIPKKSTDRSRSSLKPSKSQIFEIPIWNQEGKFLTDCGDGSSPCAENIWRLEFNALRSLKTIEWE